MGRIIIKIKSYRIGNNPVQFSDINQKPLFKSIFKPTKEELCRICHSEKKTKENPLISVCNCTGTMQFVHYNCLKLWLNYKLTIKKSEHLHSYCWKSFECEICKAQYPLNIEFEGTEYALAEVELPSNANYLLLESSSTGKVFSRTMHLLLPNESKTLFKFGRSHESDVRIADVSVSRSHAKIIMTEKGFTIEDNISKFGTLLLLNDKPNEINPNNGLSVQIGRTMITFSLRQKDLQGELIRSLEAPKIPRREINNK